MRKNWIVLNIKWLQRGRYSIQSHTSFWKQFVKPKTISQTINTRKRYKYTNVYKKGRILEVLSLSKYLVSHSQILLCLENLGQKFSSLRLNRWRTENVIMRRPKILSSFFGDISTPYVTPFCLIFEKPLQASSIGKNHWHFQL